VKKINHKSLKGGVPSGMTGPRMPARFSASPIIGAVGSNQAQPPVTMLPPRKPLNLTLLGLKKVNVSFR
jgi:hypothetical protein